MTPAAIVTMIASPVSAPPAGGLSAAWASRGIMRASPSLSWLGSGPRFSRSRTVSSEYSKGSVSSMKLTSSWTTREGASSIGQCPDPSISTRRELGTISWAARPWATGITGSSVPQMNRVGSWSAR